MLTFHSFMANKTSTLELNIFESRQYKDILEKIQIKQDSNHSNMLNGAKLTESDLETYL